MPELPEVETIRATLEPLLQGKCITSVELRLPKLVANAGVDEFSQSLMGRCFQGVTRRGKYLLFALSGDFAVVVHLRMTGQLRFSMANDPRPPHTHIILGLDGDEELRYTDARQFGWWFLAPQDHISREARLDKLGIEPLSAEFTPEVLAKLLDKRRGSLKSVLLKQDVIAGIGNIYADEALFRSKLRPDRAAHSLNTTEIAALHAAIQEVLTQGIAMRGTSFSDYIDGLGQRGKYQYELRVYGRQGEMCYTCASPIARAVVAGRGTHWCASCQT